MKKEKLQKALREPFYDSLLENMEGQLRASNSKPMNKKNDDFFTKDSVEKLKKHFHAFLEKESDDGVLKFDPSEIPTAEFFKRHDDDSVNHPSHYTSGSIECIDAIEAALTPEEFRGFCKGNALKYTWREKLKGRDECLKKAQWYLNRLTTKKGN